MGLFPMPGCWVVYSSNNESRDEIQGIFETETGAARAVNQSQNLEYYAFVPFGTVGDPYIDLDRLRRAGAS